MTRKPVIESQSTSERPQRPWPTVERILYKSEKEKFQWLHTFRTYALTHPDWRHPELVKDKEYSE
jgi:hypothetical protein